MLRSLLLCCGAALAGGAPAWAGEAAPASAGWPALRHWWWVDLPALGSAALLAMALFAFSVWLRHRRELPYLWVAALALGTLGGGVEALLATRFGAAFWPLAAALPLLLFLLLCQLMVQRYVGVLALVERSNEDLAERLREREAELQANQARLREVERRQTEAQERQRLIQDMHEGLGGQLRRTVLALRQGRLDDEEQVAGVVRACLEDLSLTIDSLQPVQADLLLLLGNLRYRLAPRLLRSGLRLRWEVEDVPALHWLDARASLQVLHLLQLLLGLLAACCRDAELRVRTPFGDGAVRVQFWCENPAFVPPPLPQEAQRRAAALGGRLAWQRSEPGGCCIELLLPLQRGVGA